MGLQAVRGIALTTAVTIAAGVGDFSRFAHAPEIMSYSGLVPSEHSSGGKKRQGGIIARHAIEKERADVGVCFRDLAHAQPLDEAIGPLSRWTAGRSVAIGEVGEAVKADVLGLIERWSTKHKTAASSLRIARRSSTLRGDGTRAPRL